MVKSCQGRADSFPLTEQGTAVSSAEGEWVLRLCRCSHSSEPTAARAGGKSPLQCSSDFLVGEPVWIGLLRDIPSHGNFGYGVAQSSSPEQLRKDVYLTETTNALINKPKSCIYSRVSGTPSAGTRKPLDGTTETLDLCQPRMPRKKHGI